MKKSGFTLAEVLITLGIIGVVAALTAPALVQNTANAQVGPTLAKVVSTVENANQKMLLDEGVSSLSSFVAKDKSESSDAGKKNISAVIKYLSALSAYISGSSYKDSALTSTDTSSMPKVKNYSETNANGRFDGWLLFRFSNSIDILFNSKPSASSSTTKGSFKGEWSWFVVDINGLNTSPNIYGKDLFMFSLDNSGKILPSGSKTYSWAYFDGDKNRIWDASSGDFACNEVTVTTGYGCAGSIFDNNLKVIYQ